VKQSLELDQARRGSSLAGGRERRSHAEKGVTGGQSPFWRELADLETTLLFENWRRCTPLRHPPTLRCAIHKSDSTSRDG
jgi:hypothetical protein